jgi:hypothetical protein
MKKETGKNKVSKIAVYQGYILGMELEAAQTRRYQNKRRLLL